MVQKPNFQKFNNFHKLFKQFSENFLQYKCVIGSDVPIYIRNIRYGVEVLGEMCILIILIFDEIFIDKYIQGAS
jgi:hypothetical protein